MNISDVITFIAKIILLYFGLRYTYRIGYKHGGQMVVKEWREFMHNMEEIGK